MLVGLRFSELDCHLKVKCRLNLRVGCELGERRNSAHRMLHVSRIQSFGVSIRWVLWVNVLSRKMRHYSFSKYFGPCMP